MAAGGSYVPQCFKLMRKLFAIALDLAPPQTPLQHAWLSPLLFYTSDLHAA
jgi:hypothetical protein